MFDVLWGKKINQSSIQNAHTTRAVGEEGRLSFHHAVAVLALLFCLHSHNSFAVTDDSIPFNIPQQRADRALTQFAEQANLTLVFPFEQVKDKTANRLVGNYPIATAVQLLLRNTGLTPAFSDHLVLTIVSEPKGKSMNTTNSSKRKTVLAGLVGLFAAGGMTQAIAQGGEAATGQGRIDEIIVTATKRETRLQDTAMSISALDNDTINKRGLVGMSDYLSALPGVTMQDRGSSQNNIIIRGIASAPQSEDSTVGVYFGESPLTGLGSNSSSDTSGSVDIKLVDIDRVEVLRGPQGTLYGSGSIGGTVRVIPVSPKLDQFESKIATRYSQTSEEGGTNTMVQGIVNVPLIEDKLAVRGVAYQFDNSGFINNIASSANNPNVSTLEALGGVAIDQDDIGSDEYDGFRITTIWQANDDLSITLGYTKQKIKQKGFPEVDMDLNEDFQQIRLGTGPEGSNDKAGFMNNSIDISNMLIEYDLGWGEIVSSSSWIDYSWSTEIDLSMLTAPLYGVLGPVYDDFETNNDVTIGEIRLTSKLDGPLQFLAGVYYENNDQKESSSRQWNGDSSLDPGFFLFLLDGVATTKQQAVFGELSYDVTDRVVATVGARFFDYEQYAKNVSNVFFANSNLDNSDRDHSYKVSLAWTPQKDTLIYAQWSEGYRIGKPFVKPNPQFCDIDNDGLIDGLGVAAKEATDPDTSENFELGVKMSLANDRINLNATVYRINWEGMPVTIVAPCFFAFVLNAGESNSEGIELETQLLVTENLTLALSASYGEAKLTEDIPLLSASTGFGGNGDNLPGSADYNLGIGLEYAFTISGFDAFFRSDYSYVDEYFHNFSETGQASGGYSRIDLKAGVAINNFEIDIFVNNLSNADEFTWVESVFGGSGNRAYRLRPRTVGLNLNYQF
jgi:outer membrane receptor protein involved in Fe transport